MKHLVTFLLLHFATFGQAQIVGKITDSNAKAIPYVNIYLENTYTGTTSNDDGNYKLSIQNRGNHTIVYQFLGYKTVTKKITIEDFPYILNITLEPETTTLQEVMLNNNEDPAERIIKATIAKQKENLGRIRKYTADFYSRGPHTHTPQGLRYLPDVVVAPSTVVGLVAASYVLVSVMIMLEHERLLRHAKLEPETKSKIRRFTKSYESSAHRVDVNMACVCL